PAEAVRQDHRRGLYAGGLSMNRARLSAFAILPLALSLAFVRDAEASDCKPPAGASGDMFAWAWGLNTVGQLGDGTTTNRHTPVPVRDLSGSTAVPGGGQHSLGLNTNGTVWAWGGNDRCQLGDGTTIQRFTPVQVQNLSGVIGVAAGDGHSLALKSDGTVWAWGGNNHGQLGDGTTTDRHTPVPVRDLAG